MRMDERYNAENLSATEWRRQAAKLREEVNSLRRDNERLRSKLAAVTHTVTDIRRDLYWHVDSLEKTLNP